MSCGLVVVATNVGAVSEAVLDGKTGLIVPPEHPEELAKALFSLISNRTKLESMSHAAQKRFDENYNIELTIKKIIHACNATANDQKGE